VRSSITSPSSSALVQRVAQELLARVVALPQLPVVVAADDEPRADGTQLVEHGDRIALPVHHVDRLGQEGMRVQRGIGPPREFGARTQRPDAPVRRRAPDDRPQPDETERAPRPIGRDREREVAEEPLAEAMLEAPEPFATHEAAEDEVP
jgi:hypothetical protein